MQNAKQIIAQKVMKTASKHQFRGGFWSEWGDSNSRHLAPKASALPTALHPVMELFYLWSYMWSWPFFDQRLCGNGSRFR